MGIVLYDYVIEDERGVRSTLTGIDLPPDQYKAKLQPYGLHLVRANMAGTIGAGAEVPAPLTAVVAIDPAPALMNVQTFFESHRKVILVSGVLLAALVAFHYGQTT